MRRRWRTELVSLASWVARLSWRRASSRSPVVYVQTDLEADRQVANALAALIIQGSLASVLTDS